LPPPFRLLSVCSPWRRVPISTDKATLEYRGIVVGVTRIIHACGGRRGRNLDAKALEFPELFARAAASSASLSLLPGIELNGATA
jgi:hypothetical protein